MTESNGQSPQHHDHHQGHRGVGDLPSVNRCHRPPDHDSPAPMDAWGIVVRQNGHAAGGRLMRPTSVILALVFGLIGLGLALLFDLMVLTAGFFVSALSGIEDGAPTDFFRMFPVLIVINVAEGAFLWVACAGRNWARVICIVCGSLTFLAFLLILFFTAGLGYATVLFFPMGLYVTSTILLVCPPAHRWFAAKRAEALNASGG